MLDYKKFQLVEFFFGLMVDGFQPWKAEARNERNTLKLQKEIE